MHIFIDESGNFSGFKTQSLSVVGALVVPDQRLLGIKNAYKKLRNRLPKSKSGEVKGRSLNEKQINDIVLILMRHEVFFEVTFIDLFMHEEHVVAGYKDAHVAGMGERIPRFVEPSRTQIRKAVEQIKVTSLPLYLQALTTFELIHHLIGYATAYYSQRRPSELGSFSWVIDGKDPMKVTNWEAWWSWYAQGALSNMSKRRPSPMIKGADYSYYKRFNATGPEGEEGTDLSLLLKDIRFSTDQEFGLELVDILVNATRRALTGNLAMSGWQNIPRLMIHRSDPYIPFIVIGPEEDVRRNPPYASIVNRYFSVGGKNMITSATWRAMEDE